jgi:condensin complex subunit 1
MANFKILTIIFVCRSSNVRKQSVQLLTLLLQCNPYNSSLPVEEIREKFEKEKATLTEMLPKDDKEDAEKVAAEKMKQWTAIEAELSEFEAENDASEDNLWENAAPGEVHERIRHHLIQRKFGPAITLLQAAKDEFPVFKNLEVADEDLQAQLRTIFFMPLFREIAISAEEANGEVSDEAKKQQILVNYYKDSMNFATVLNEALPTVCTLLGSKQVSDAQEAINFFVVAYEFGLLNAMMGVRKMLSLIFSR